MSWPATELEWWAVTFSIMDNGDKPIRKINTVEQKSKLRERMR